VRPALRLLPLTLCIAVSLQAHAADGKSAPTYKLCPLVDAVPAFEDVQKAPEGLNILNNNQLPTDLEGDLLSGTEANPVFNGNVTMRRGDQFMGADQLTFDKAQNRYNAEGSVRYQAQRVPKATRTPIPTPCRIWNTSCCRGVATAKPRA